MTECNMVPNIEFSLSINHMFLNTRLQMHENIRNKHPVRIKFYVSIPVVIFVTQFPIIYKQLTSGYFQRQKNNELRLKVIVYVWHSSYFKHSTKNPIQGHHISCHIGFSLVERLYIVFDITIGISDVENLYRIRV